MATDRQTPCLYYVCVGLCKKGRKVDHVHYCQRCNKYKPRENIMDKALTFGIERMIISEQSKREICEACKAMLKNLDATEEQLEKFERDFYAVAEKYIFGAKKKE